MRELIRVNSLEEALGKKGAYLAGGTEILRLDSPLDKAISVIDILPFLSKEVEDEGDWIRIGAGCTFSSLLSSALIPSFLKEALSYMSSPELREMATIGGNIASFRDDSFLIPTLASASARLEILLPGGKECIPLSSFKRDGGIILSITVSKTADVKNFRESLTSHSHAVVTAAFSSECECYAVKGSGIFFDHDSLSFASDMYGSAEYKRYLSELYRSESGRS